MAAGEAIWRGRCVELEGELEEARGVEERLAGVLMRCEEALEVARQRNAELEVENEALRGGPGGASAAAGMDARCISPTRRPKAAGASVAMAQQLHDERLSWGKEKAKLVARVRQLQMQVDAQQVRPAAPPADDPLLAQAERAAAWHREQAAGTLRGKNALLALARVFAVLRRHVAPFPRASHREECLTVSMGAPPREPTPPGQAPCDVPVLQASQAQPSMASSRSPVRRSPTWSPGVAAPVQGVQMQTRAASGLPSHPSPARSRQPASPPITVSAPLSDGSRSGTSSPVTAPRMRAATSGPAGQYLHPSSASPPRRPRSHSSARSNPSSGRPSQSPNPVHPVARGEAGQEEVWTGALLSKRAAAARCMRSLHHGFAARVQLAGQRQARRAAAAAKVKAVYRGAAARDAVRRRRAAGVLQAAHRGLAARERLAALRRAADPAEIAGHLVRQLGSDVATPVASTVAVAVEGHLSNIADAEGWASVCGEFAKDEKAPAGGDLGRALMTMLSARDLAGCEAALRRRGADIYAGREIALASSELAALLHTAAAAADPAGLLRVIAALADQDEWDAVCRDYDALYAATPHPHLPAVLEASFTRRALAEAIDVAAAKSIRVFPPDAAAAGPPPPGPLADRLAAALRAVAASDAPRAPASGIYTALSEVADAEHWAAVAKEFASRQEGRDGGISRAFLKELTPREVVKCEAILSERGARLMSDPWPAPPRSVTPGRRSRSPSASARSTSASDAARRHTSPLRSPLSAVTAPESLTLLPAPPGTSAGARSHPSDEAMPVWTQSEDLLSPHCSVASAVGGSKGHQQQLLQQSTQSQIQQLSHLPQQRSQPATQESHPLQQQQQQQQRSQPDTQRVQPQQSQHEPQLQHQVAYQQQQQSTQSQIQQLSHLPQQLSHPEQQRSQPDTQQLQPQQSPHLQQQRSQPQSQLRDQQSQHTQLPPHVHQQQPPPQPQPYDQQSRHLQQQRSQPQYASKAVLAQRALASQQRARESLLSERIKRPLPMHPITPPALQPPYVAVPPPPLTGAERMRTVSPRRKPRTAVSPLRARPSDLSTPGAGGGAAHTAALYRREMDSLQSSLVSPLADKRRTEAQVFIEESNAINKSLGWQANRLKLLQQAMQSGDPAR